MNELLSDIDRAVASELARANAKYGDKHHSPHESYAVILEEVEEADDEIDAFKTSLQSYWNSIKRNMGGKCFLEIMHEQAKNAAAEWVQVAAMCRKALDSIDRED